MYRMTEFPEWVWQLVDAIHAYEDEHPMLYRMTAPDEYEQTMCFGAFLGGRDAWPPQEVQAAAEVRRQALQSIAHLTTEAVVGGGTESER